MRSTTLAILTSLVLGSTAHAQVAPPPAPQGRGAAQVAPSASARVRIDASGVLVQVGEQPGCTTVQVCPGAPSQTPAAAPPPPPPPPPPPAPPAPPAAPDSDLVPPPAPYPYPMAAPPAAPFPTAVPAARPHLWDPARTRLGITGTAEVLGHGDWQVTSRGIVGLLELSVGLGNRFELGVKTSPVTWFLPDLKLKDALWAAEIRAQIWRSPLFKLTAELSYFHVAGLHGVRPGLSMKIGGDRVAFHASVGTVLVIGPKAQQMDTCAGPTSYDRESGEYQETSSGCTGMVDEPERPVLPIAHASLGFEVRFWRHGKFFLEGLAAGGPGTPTVATLIPGVRFHGSSFAADLGLGVLNIGGETNIPMPVLNFSYRW